MPTGIVRSYNDSKEFGQVLQRVRYQVRESSEGRYVRGVGLVALSDAS